MTKLLFLLSILVIALTFPLLFNMFFNKKENFSNYNLANANGEFPKAIDSRLLSFYPSTNKNGISNEEAQNMWWHYPDFKVGSYDQITNNIKYPNNPDVGNCMPASMCGTLYKEKQEYSNYVEPLPPVPDCPGSRVNYYRTEPNMLVFKSDGNILY